MIVITGAAGFIGSCLLNRLNNKGHHDIIIVDDFSNPVKNKNILNKAFISQVHRNDFFTWLDANHKNVSFVFSIGILCKILNTMYGDFSDYSLRYWHKK